MSGCIQCALHRHPGGWMDRTRTITLALRTTLTLMCALLAAAPARAAVTLVDNDKAKIDLELRFMSWAVYAGPDLIPGTNTAPPVTQTENIEDFFVRKARMILRGKVGPSLE